MIHDSASEHHAHERELQASEERFRLFVENVRDYAIVMLDRDGHVETWNPGAKQFKGYRAEEIIGRHFSVFFIPDDVAAGVPDHELGVAARNGQMEDEGWRVRKDGSRFWASVVITAVRDEDGTLRGYGKIIRDLTERKRADERLKLGAAELQRANEDLQRSNAELAQFAYVASHDLQEPLRVIGGFVELLARRYEGKLDADADRYITATVSGVQRLRDLIDALLRYSRVGNVTVAREPVDTGTLVHAITERMRDSLDEGDATIVVSELPTVDADPVLLDQLFQNLISNALKFTQSDTPRVAISADRDSRGWTFAVKDNGPGIQEQYRDRIFEMFKRLHGRSVAGTGIGLAICKRIVDRHGGRIWVESQPGEGSTFKFTLPTSADHTQRS